MTIDELIQQSHSTAVDKGWWETERSFGDQLANMHAELSEAWEEYREWGLTEGRFLYHADDKPEGIAVEFADVLIRIFDTCGRYGIPLNEALRQKLEFNRFRPHRHGNKHA